MSEPVIDVSSADAGPASAILDRLRAGVFQLVASRRGDRLPPLRWSKAAVRFANDRLGRPLCSQEELAERRALEAVIAQRSQVDVAADPEAAPVVVFHKDKYRRELDAICELLQSVAVPYEVRNVEDDEATTEAVARDSGGRELPVVFIAGECVGGRRELVDLQGRGELVSRVWSRPVDHGSGDR